MNRPAGRQQASSANALIAEELPEEQANTENDDRDSGSDANVGVPKSLRHVEGCRDGDPSDAHDDDRPEGKRGGCLS